MSSTPARPDSDDGGDGADHARGRRRRSRILATGFVASLALGVVVAGLAAPFAVLAGVTARHLDLALTELPTSLVLRQLPQRSTIVDRDGDVVTHVFEQNRVDVDLATISRRMVKAILAVEDARFYEHGAIDVQGTARALLLNSADPDGSVQGGSSISQQVVKMSLVEQARTDEERRSATEESYARKIRELRYAVAMEQTYSKDWILERYLNLAYFGEGAYGVQAAARRYFSVDAADLTLTQAALLAGLVKNPVGYEPTRHPERARARRDLVLRRLQAVGAVSARATRRALRSPLGLRPEAVPNGCVSSTAPFFCEYVVAHLLQDTDLGRSRKERLRALRTGGLLVRTTLDLDHQRAADAAVAARVDPGDDAVGALAMVEPGTGEVRALAQSRPLGGDPATGGTFVNHVVPERFGGGRGFPAGSTFKAFVLAAALEAGIPADTAFPSPDTATFDQADYANCEGEPPFAGTFTVRNTAVQSAGVETLTTATRRSINTFFLRLEQETGVCEPFRLARAMGVELDAPEGDEQTQPERVPMFTLGVANASPLEMAEAYATFAARGVHCAARPVTAVVAGGAVREVPPSCGAVISAPAADAVNEVLRGVMEPGGYGAPHALDQPAAAKTGNNEGSAVWFVGYTPQLSAAAVLAGVDSAGAPALLNGMVVGGAPILTPSASADAAPMWGAAMGAIDDRLPYGDFVAPVP